MTTTPKGTTVGTINIQPGELIHMDFAFYNVTSIRGFTFMLTVVFVKTKIICVLPTASKQSTVRKNHFIIKLLNNEQYTCKRVIVY